MFVNEVNDVKIYNLSAGKTVPEWLTDRKKQAKLKKSVDSRRQIQLIQDFTMPVVSTSIRMSPDQQYILATGTYKPRIKCFEVNNLSIKFERCFDSEVTTFEPISDDYSKLIFLQCDRYIEIHAAHGRHYRLRIPKFGRDMKFHKPSCDLFVVGTGKDIYRLNLERGQFLQPYETAASCLNACAISSEHNLLMVGSKEATVEAWDPRSKTKCATLDVGIQLLNAKELPSVTALSFKNGLHMGVGTASGHVLLYDIRSKTPLLIKDHLNRVPIKRIAFNPSQETVYSLDEAMLKLWDENTGKQKAYIESATNFNDFCTIPDTGLFFLAQEDVKMLTYYIPAMGPAPRWCSFLDTFIEQIETEVAENIYDDYQFVTQKDLEELNLENLIGTNLLKAYMHGYFMDVRLYNKAKAAADPFAFERFRRDKIRQEIESERKPRLQLNKNLPKVNQELALKLMEDELNPSASAAAKQSKKTGPSLLQDTRFKAMFENNDFEINKNAEEYKLLAPVLKRLDKSKVKELKKRVEVSRVVELQADEQKPHEESDNDEDLFGFENSDNNKSDDDDSEAEASTDDEDRREFARDMKKAYKDIKKQRKDEELENDEDDALIDITETSDVKPIISNNGVTLNGGARNKNLKLVSLDDLDEQTVLHNRLKKVSLQDRVKAVESINSRIKPVGGSLGNRQMTFDLKKKAERDAKKRELEMKKHREERKKVVRPISSLRLKKVNFK